MGKEWPVSASGKTPDEILREYRCRITSFFSGSKTQYVVKRGILSISPSALTLEAICEWIVENEDFISQRAKAIDDFSQRIRDN